MLANLVLLALLAAEGPYAASVPRSIEQLSDREFSVRWHAAYALGQAGPAAAPAVDPLLKVLENQGEEEYVRGAAAWALGRIGPDAEKAVPLLARTLVSKHVSVRRNAARALGELGRPALSAAPELTKLLDDPDPVARVYAAGALWKLDRRDKALALLLQWLGGDAASACPAATLLGGLKADPAQTAPALIAALGHGDEDVRRAAAEALGEIGAAAVDPLTSALKNPSADIRRGAARVLGRLGPAAKPAEAALAEAARDADPQVRQAAAWALGRL